MLLPQMLVFYKRMSAGTILILAAACCSMVLIATTLSGPSPSVTSLEAGLGPEVVSQPL